MTNGHMTDVAPAVSVAFDLSGLSYGDLRRLQTLDATSAAGQAMLDTVLEKAVIGGLDAIPIVEITAVVKALMAKVTESMSGKNQLAAPSLTASGAAESETRTT